MFSTNHRIVGLQYFGAAMAFLLVGFLLMLVMRWQLAWPTAPLPPAIAAVVGEANAPGGYMVPEFYNQLVAMHGTVMIFLAVVPLLTGAFGTYVVPRQIGAPSVAFPRLSAAAFWIYVIAGGLMLSGFFTRGGAANSGWTSYPPLAVIAPRGQDFWLVGLLLLGVAVMLQAITMIATVVQLRREGLRFMELPFFVWGQLVAALLLWLAFPALQAAGLLQLSDRLVGTSFFLPSGLMVNGAPAEISGGGNPLLWQHLFWFLGHPEVYVLALPAIGIVSEVIAHGTGRPLWGYRGMVAAVLFLGVMSLLVWAHHMFLTGMGTTLGTFFQVTTMIVSIPSVVLITSLVLSLWGGSIRFTLPMLFALAFIPMFGIGGLSGLPLGLAPSDVLLHDTWYVVGHFHFLVAPGTLFAIFAGIYHWFPAVAGRALHHRLGVLHFWGSIAAMTAVFLPMFTLGLRGVNRRLYDAGLQYAHAQDTLPIQVHMTYAAVALGLAQVPFLANVLWTWRAARADRVASRGGRGGPDDDERLARAHEGETLPWTFTARADTRVSTVRLGIWLCLASGTMLFASLFSAYVLLRTGSASWPAASEWTSIPVTFLMTALLAGALLTIERVKKQLLYVPSAGMVARRLWLGAGLAACLVGLHVLDVFRVLSSGRHPADSVALACWFVLSGTFAAFVVVGGAGNLAVARTAGRIPALHLAERVHALRLFWSFLGVTWIVLLASWAR